MTIDTQRLRELAQKATPGPWKAGCLASWNADGVSCRFVYRGKDESVQTRVRIKGGEGVNGSVFDCDADAEYIAAANPATVLALLDEIDRLRTIEAAASNLDKVKGRHHAEIAYQILIEALGHTPEQMSELTLTDLAAAAAARLDDQPPPADVAMLASANRAISLRMAEVIEALHKAPVPFSEAIDNDQHLVSNVEAIVAELAGEQVRARELQGVIIGLHTLLDQVRHALDLSPAASSMDILAEIENLSRLTDRAIQLGARDAVQGPYLIISDPRGCAGIYETIDEAKKHAARMALRTTTGRAAIVQTLAEVTLVPQWSDEA